MGEKQFAPRFSLAKLLSFTAAFAAFLGVPAFCFAVSPDMFWAGLFIAYALATIGAIIIPFMFFLTFVILITPESTKELYWDNLKRAFKLSLLSLMLLLPLASFALHKVIFSLKTQGELF